MYYISYRFRILTKLFKEDAHFKINSYHCTITYGGQYTLNREVLVSLFICLKYGRSNKHADQYEYKSQKNITTSFSFITISREVPIFNDTLFNDYNSA